MTLIIKFKEGQKQLLYLVSLQELSTDFKSALTLQLKELIDEIEDCEEDRASIGSVRVITFLEDCYRVA